ncbi:chitin synthase-domain-containing protein [Pilobolus umbonatus]|nr:chitin synthase-domain-containing protein [Pilobolus umbonatus]
MNQQYINVSHSLLIALASPFNDKTSDYIAEYKDTTSARLNQWREPHLFQLVNHAYIQLRRTSVHQSILFSGEPGSGTSIQFNQGLDYLLTLTHHPSTLAIQTRILSNYHLLQSFSPNILVQLHFTDRGRLSGSTMTVYPFDMSRVTSMDIFYAFMNSVTDEERIHYQLTDTSDKAEIKTHLLSILPTHQPVFDILAAMLHLSHLTHDTKLVSELLGVEPHVLVNVVDERDELVQFLYLKLIMYLVHHINQSQLGEGCSIGLLKSGDMQDKIHQFMMHRLFKEDIETWQVSHLPSFHFVSTHPLVSILVAQQESVPLLMDTLSTTLPWFVLCVHEFNGVREMANKLKWHYTNQYTHEEFIERYGITETTSKEDTCLSVLKTMGWTESSMKVDPSKVYLSNQAFRTLEDEIRHMEIPIHPKLTDPSPPLISETHPILPTSHTRYYWLCFVYTLTWYIPILGLPNPEVRLAWREKVALCLSIFFLSLTMVLFIVFFGPFVCPYQPLYSPTELAHHPDFISIRGEVFDLTKYSGHHWATEVIPDRILLDYAGKDVTDLFPVQVSALCDGTLGRVAEEVVLDFQVNFTDPNAAYHDFRFFTSDYRPDWYFEQMVYLRKNYRVGFMGHEPDEIHKQKKRRWAILHGDVYDLTHYVLGGRAPRSPEGYDLPSHLDLHFMDKGIVQLFRQLAGTDISSHFDALPLSDQVRHRQKVCLRNLFFVGKVDTRRSVACQFSEYSLLIITGFLCAVILVKFLAALQLGATREPEEYDKFIVCQVPCYTESEESLRKTIDSIAVLRYDDKRKLLFLVCDGMIVGSGNDRPTPRIVLDILGVNVHVHPDPLSFLSLGEGNRQHNQAKIYSGLYECCGHVVPYVVVVKVGAPTEKQKPGNRGKRDSQMVLMRFLNKVHFESPMTPMELEIYHQIKDVIGVNPRYYEFVLMVDADTEVLADSLNRMVSCFVHDSKIIGLCGETKLANEKESWVTMIQVYEYYISHFLSKAFESLFGSVTCLPGCFCMYRVRSPNKHQPLLISHQVIEDYAENKVDTLHQKNLLHLGEDRYLTTLILKHFPTYKTKFTPDAGCLTNAPERWSVLLSQRRRWINSTIHNLGELVFLPELCGFCCFSMRFVVILDLLSTLVMPAVVCYLGFLIYRLATDPGQVPLISIITLCGVYGLQAILFILRGKWEHIGWMIVYILAIPLFSFFIPIYSFWHFDDFSWGNTRLVINEDTSFIEEAPFDPASIPLTPFTQQDIVEIPTEEELCQHIQWILSHADYMVITKNKIRDQLSRQFGVCLDHRKEFIHYCIDKYIVLY